MLCKSEKCNKNRGHGARLHIVDGLYSNFATDEIVSTYQQKRAIEILRIALIRLIY